jgi:hypothetical protein
VRVRPARHLLPLTAAVTGVVVAHAANYALAIPDPASRGQELARTGHGYWPVAVATATVAAVVALALAIRRGLRGRAPSLPAISPGRLAGAQVVFFLVIETLERIGAGLDPVPFLHSSQLVLGLALQVVVALAAVLVLRSIERGARALAGAVRRSPRHASAGAHTWALANDDVLDRWWGTAGDARGPPAPALT